MGRKTKDAVCVRDCFNCIHPDCIRDECNAKRRAYRAAHRDEINAYQRAYRAKKKAEAEKG